MMNLKIIAHQNIPERKVRESIKRNNKLKLLIESTKIIKISNEIIQITILPPYISQSYRVTQTG